MTPDIDLIPGDYRERRWRLRTLRACIAGVVVVSAGLGLSAAAVAGQAADIEKAIAEARKRQAVVSQQQTMLEQLNARVASMQSQVNLLDRLKSPGAASDLFILLHGALPDDRVWLDELRLSRADDLDEEGSSNGEPVQNTVRSVLSLDGHAVSHADLSRFVQRLYDSEHVKDVRLDRSTRQNTGAREAVGFALSVVLEHRVEERA
ncbi:MAG: PilN domain-containing protein [Pseudomonadota bacterium]